MAIQNNVSCQWARLSEQLPQTCSKWQESRWISFHNFPRTDAVLFIVHCHGLSHCTMGVTARPVECKMTTLVIDGSNVSSSHGCPRVLAMRTKFQGLKATEKKALTL